MKKRVKRIFGQELQQFCQFVSYLCWQPLGGFQESIAVNDLQHGLRKLREKVFGVGKRTSRLFPGRFKNLFDKRRAVISFAIFSKQADKHGAKQGDILFDGGKFRADFFRMGGGISHKIVSFHIHNIISGLTGQSERNLSG